MTRIFAMLLAGLSVLCAGCSGEPVRDTGGGQTPAEINVQLGTAYLQEGQVEVALNKYKKALRQDPDLPSAHNGIAILYEQIGELGPAEKHYLKALRLDPRDSRIKNNYGTFLCRQGKYKKSIEFFLEAVEDPLYASPASALTNAGLCARMIPDDDQAEKYYRMALERDPLYAPALISMARLGYATGEYMTARAYLTRFQNVAGTTPESLWLGVRVEKELGDTGTMARYALLLKNKYPDSIETRQLLEWENGGRPGQ